MPSSARPTTHKFLPAGAVEGLLQSCVSVRLLPNLGLQVTWEGGGERGEVMGAILQPRLPACPVWER